LQAVKASKPDVILLDLHMPGKDGFDFLDELKASKQSPKPKVVVVTAHGSIKNLLKAQGKGISNYQFMTKPFRSDELLAVVLSAALPKRV
jgi:CheY-like chemotaxis protein